ncbi:MAG TPA: hypothetical protein VFD43_10195, partial [Planctomycetota bacterium]|nr:hypothetical protein [Planctomycetota bacterium]
MPKLKRVVEALDALPEGERGYYVKGQDGKFYLDFEGAEEQHRALVSERQRAEAAEFRLKAYGDLTPDQAKETVQKLAALGDLTDIKQRAADAAVWKSKHDEANARLAALDRENSELALARLANESFDAHKVRGRRAVMLAVKEAVRPVVENGQRLFRVFGPDGKPLTTKRQGASDPYMTADEYIGDVLRSDPEFSAHYDGSGAAGSGAGG